MYMNKHSYALGGTLASTLNLLTVNFTCHFVYDLYYKIFFNFFPDLTFPHNFLSLVNSSICLFSPFRLIIQEVEKHWSLLGCTDNHSSSVVKSDSCLCTLKDIKWWVLSSYNSFISLVRDIKKLSENISTLLSTDYSYPYAYWLLQRTMDLQMKT